MFGRMLERRKTLKRLKEGRDKRKLEDVYHVNWEAPLGEGGFGAVFAAANKNTGKFAALKVISKEYTNDDGFRREMEALLQIRGLGGHPNLCGLHENFDEGGKFYLTLDYISGGEMFDHLINSGAYSEADAARLIREVASALSFLHGSSIVHCDLKPENLMLSTENRNDSVVKIIDFGTAQVLDETANPMVPSSDLGTTPAYCPPEVLEDPASMKQPSMDIWAVGVILYIMLVGSHPFDVEGNATEEEISERVLNMKSLPMKDSPYTAHLSDSAIDLLDKLLCWNEDKRFTADDMLQHPWVQGITAKKDKIADSGTKLSNLKKFKSRLEAKVFQDFMAFADASNNGDNAGGGDNKMSLMERSFRQLDASSTGVVTAKDLGEGLNESVDSDEEISLTTFSELLSDRMQNCYFKKGDVIFKEGDEGKDMFFINSGAVEVSTSGGFRTVLSAGDFVGEAAILTHAKRSGTVKCNTPVHAIRITKQYFEKYLSASDSELNIRMLDAAKNRASSRQIFGGFSNLLAANERNKKSFKQGDVIYREGDEGGDMFFIKSGVVSVTSKDGFKTTLKDGYFVGEGALLNNKPRSGSVTCLTPVEGMTISRDYFETFMNSSDTSVRLKMYRESRARELSRIRMLLRHNPNLRPKKLKKGDVLFKEGQKTKSLYIVIDGEISLSSYGLSVAQIKQGDITGAHSLLLDGPRPFTARCISGECNVVEVGPSAFEEVVAACPTLTDSLRNLCYQQDFQRALTLYSKDHFPRTVEGFRDLFGSIKNNMGTEIVVEDIGRVMKRVNPKISEEEVLALFRAMDVNGNGSLSVEEFEALFYCVD
ncbi:MAG: hypothetical protein SGBAC_003704 [Bacillariaceae sp.]